MSGTPPSRRRQDARSGRGAPDGKRALFEARVDAPDDLIAPGADRSGRRALYSVGRPRVGTVMVECSSCKARSRRSLVDVGLRLAKLSVWIPGRSHNRWMDCPSCEERTWCRVGWLE